MVARMQNIFSHYLTKKCSFVTSALANNACMHACMHGIFAYVNESFIEYYYLLNTIVKLGTS